MGNRPAGLAAALVADLTEIAVNLAEGGYTPSTVAMLQRNLRRSVPSALGATVTLLHLSCPQGRPIHVHLVDRPVTTGEIGAVLRVPLPQPPGALRSSIAFYAGEPAAFTDLAADLAAVLGIDSRALDARLTLPDEPLEPGVTGLLDLTVVNIALGCLLNRGRTLDQARAELSQHALRLDTDIARAARTLLDAPSY